MEPLALIYAAVSCWPPELAKAALQTFVVDSVVGTKERHFRTLEVPSTRFG
jgi:hypothetical protein